MSVQAAMEEAIRAIAALAFQQVVRCRGCKHWRQGIEGYPEGGPHGSCERIEEGITVYDDSRPVQTEAGFGCVYGEAVALEGKPNAELGCKL